MTKMCVLVTTLALGGISPAFSQVAVGSGVVSSLYETHCAACHGADLAGALGSSLIDDEWAHGGDDASITRVITDGLPDLGMTAFGDVLSDEEVRSLVIFVRESRLLANQDAIAAEAAPTDGVYSTDHHQFALENIYAGPGALWGLAVFPDGQMLATEQDGAFFMITAEGTVTEIANPPEVWAHGQGGLLDVALHPDHADNGWVYLAFSASSGEENGAPVGMTKVVRGRIAEGAWVDEETVFETPEAFHTRAGHHFGTRLVFHDGYLFFSIGDRGDRDGAQDIGKPNGKVHRIHDDGRVPSDNPFVEEEGAYASVWSYGHRNPQGLVRHPETGVLYDTEHGPRGGDELNAVEPGLNYGWPVITYGMNYNGTPITDLTEQEGMEQPVTYWTPSIAACGLAVYGGDAFPEWRGDLFAGGLASEELRRLRIGDDGAVVEQEIVLKGQGRVRDVKSGPDGSLYVVVNESGDDGRSTIFRLVDADKT